MSVINNNNDNNMIANNNKNNNKNNNNNKKERKKAQKTFTHTHTLKNSREFCNFNVYFLDIHRNLFELCLLKL